MDTAQTLHAPSTITQQSRSRRQEHTLQSDQLMPASTDTQSVCEKELLSLKSSVCVHMNLRSQSKARQKNVIIKIKCEKEESE